MPNPPPIELPGVNPARQKRSQEMSLALLEAGQRMLIGRGFAELSIEELCASIGASVGAFYSRFESKEAYFNALQHLACRRGEAWLEGEGAPERLAGALLDQICLTLVAGSVAWIRAHEGVVRAALQHGGTRPDRWTPFKELGRRAQEHWRPLLLGRLDRGTRRGKERAIGFAFQLLFGTLVNIVLNDPGPLSLGDRDLPAHLAKAMAGYLEAA